MLLYRTGRMSAAALDQAFKSPGSFVVQVSANRHRDLTLSLRKGHTLQRHRVFCASVGSVDPAHVHLGKPPRDPHPAESRDSSSGFVIPEWGRLDRVNAVAADLSKRAQTEGGGHLHITRQPPVGVKRRRISRGELVGDVLFTANWGVPSCSGRTVQIRASSTAAAAKKSEERTADSDQGEEQNLKETSAAEKAPMEPEPEGGKPSKTQQLKKVFKEYGAVGVSFHIGISLMSLGMFYVLLSSGIDMAAVLCKLGFSEAVVQSKMAAGTSTFVLAYAIHKLFAPVRISITLVSVPLIVRYFRKTGLFKPPTPAP